MQAAAFAFTWVVKAGTKLLISAGLSKGSALAVSKFAVQTVLLTSASFALNAIMAPRVDAGGSPTEWRADENAPLPVLVGTRGVAGRIVHQDAYGPDNRFKSFVTVISAAGPIKSFGTFKADRVSMNFGANGVATNGGQFKDNMWMQTAPGDQPQAAALVQTGLPGGGTLPGWGSASKLSGKAHCLWTLRQDSKFKTYPGGEPVPLWDGAEGIYGWDPRLDSTWPGGSGSCRLDDPSTHVWINRPGLAALNHALGFRENGQVVMGMGLSLDAVDVDAHVAVENICDANDWTVSAYPTTDDSKAEVYRAFLQAAGAIYATRGGKLSPIPRTPKVSVATVSAADTAGPLELDTSSPLLERYNTIIPSCVQADQDWQIVPLEPVTEASYVTADGRERRRGITYAYVADADQAAQLAAYDMVDSREGIRGRLALKPYMRKLQPGDVFTITEPGFALDGVKCLVLERETDPATSVTRVTFRSESDGKHAYALGLTGVAPQTPTVSAFDPFDVAQPGASAWSAVASTGRSPAIIVTGALDADREANAVRLEVRPTEDENGDPVSYPDIDTGWDRVGDYDADVTQVTITGLRPATPYEVAVSYVSPFNVPGARRIIGTVTTGALVADESARVGSIAADAIERAIEDGSELAAALLALAFDAQEERLRRELLAVEAARNVFNDMLVGINEARDRADDLLEDAIAALADDLTLLEVAINDADAGLQAQINARATISQLNQAIVAEQQARASQISGLSASVQNLETESGAYATITFVNNAIATEQGARATAVSSLQSQIDAIDTGGGGPDLSGYATITALNNVETSLTAAIATKETDITAAYTAALSSKADISYVDASFASATAAIATSEANLQAQINALDPSGDGPDFSSYALISYVDTVIATEQAARATAIQTLQAELTSLSNSAATIAYVIDAVATETSARASALAQLEATLDAAKASVQYVDDAVATETSARASAISTLSASLTNSLNALAQDVTTVEAEVDSLLAARLIRVSAGNAAAGIQFSALEDDGGSASALHFFAQVFGYGTTVDDPRFFIDAQNGVMYALNAAGTHRTFEVEFDTGRVIHRAADGTIHYDSANGGTQTAGLAAGAVTNTDYREAGNTPLPSNGSWATVSSFTYAAEGGSVGFETSITISHTTTVEVGVEAALFVNGTKRGPSAYFKPATTFLSDMHFKRRVASGLSGNCSVEIRCRASNTLGGVAGLAATATVVDILETKR